MTSRWILAAALGVGLGLAAPIGPSWANCFEDCQDTCRDLSGHVTSDECVNTCSRQYCEKHERPYGAIAYGADSAAVGWSYDYETKRDAERRALTDCAKHGDDCKLVVSLFNSCGAVAAGDNKRFAVGQAPKSEDAQSSALAACTRHGGTKCEIQAWSCAFK
ncbi:MAG TPA: DUF4189 domain-containing protein [Stellaceae bacterium]|nr:DUF4189 domain-containing protein [Stellaceae bacterium]